MKIDPTPQATPTRDEAVLDESKVTTAMIDAAFKVCPAGAISEIGTGGMQRMIAAALASAPAPASGRVDAVAVKAPYHGARFIISAEGVWLDGVSYPTAEAALAVFDRIRSALSPAATPVSEAEPVANDCPNCGGSGIVNIDRDDDDNCPECSGIGDEPSTCYNTGLHCLAGCDGKTCIGANLPLNRWPAQALAKPASSPAGGDVREALKAIAEGYAVSVCDDRYIIVDNPAYRPDDGSSPKLVLDTASLSQSTSAGRVGE